MLCAADFGANWMQKPIYNMLKLNTEYTDKWSMHRETDLWELLITNNKTT